MSKLLLKDVFFGKTDAKNEFFEDTEEERDTFMQGFLLPEVINLDDFRFGRKYFITGLKGTGKTALMRYISLHLIRNYQSNTHFFLLIGLVLNPVKTQSKKIMRQFGNGLF